MQGDIGENKDNPIDANFIKEKKYASFNIPMAANFAEEILKQYQPDKEFEFRSDGRSPYQKFLEEHFFDFEKGKGWKYKEKPTAYVTGKMLAVSHITEVDKEGDPYLKKSIVKKVIGNQTKFLEYLKLSDPAGTERKKLIETSIYGAGSWDYDAFADSSLYDFGATIPIAKGDAEYVPIMGGPFSKQLYLFDFLSMHAKAFEMWNHNPVAHQIIKITTFFTLGRGVQVKFKNAKAQAHWDKFEKRNKFYYMLREHWCDELSRDGELIFRIFKDPIGNPGEVVIRRLDPSTVWEIITDPEDIEKVYYAHQQYPTPYQVFYEQDNLNIPSTKYVINHIAACEMLHYKINCDSGEKRGRSDLFPIMTWIKRLKDFYTARTIRAIMQACVVWKNIIKGDLSDVQAAMNAYGKQPPLAGTLHWENEASTLTPMAIDLKGSDARDDGEALLNLVCVGAGIPRQYLGIGSDQAKGTAVIASEPGMKKFQDRQELVKQIVRDVAELVTEEGMTAGKIPAAEKEVPEQIGQRIIEAVRKADFWTAMKLIWIAIRGGQMVDVDKTFDVIIPELIIEDRTAKIKDLTMMKLNKWISNEMAATIAAKEMHIDTFDFKEEQKKLADEMKAGTYGEEIVPTLNPGSASGIRYQVPKPGAGQPATGATGQEKIDIKKVAKEVGMDSFMLEAFIKEINEDLSKDLKEKK
jgi:hypothetical protein